jgi:hypothetical protein
MNRNQIWQGKKLEDKIIEKNSTVKINSNKTNNNEKNRDQIQHVKTMKNDEIKNKINFINYFK